jgi:hypothetical protein
MVEQVQIPHSIVEGKKPLPAEVIVGGLAVNLTDYTLYSKGYDNVVIKVSGLVAIEDDNVSDVPVYLAWVRQTRGTVHQYITTTKLSFNPATGILQATKFVGNGAALTGLTKAQVTDALGYTPVSPVGTPLAPPATDLATAIALANSIRAVLIDRGIGS